FCAILCSSISLHFPYTTLFRSPRFGACFFAASDQSPYSFWRISRRSCASRDSVAVGRASRRCRPMGSPVSSHHPYSPESIRVSRSEEHTSELQSRENLVCRLLL